VVLLIPAFAALAMLAFIGNFSKDANLKSLLLGLSNPLSFFAHGAALAVLSAMFAYLSQASWADKSSLWGNTLRLFSMVLALGSLLLFAGGISHAHAVFAAFSLVKRAHGRRPKQTALDAPKDWIAAAVVPEERSLIRHRNRSKRLFFLRSRLALRLAGMTKFA
jgi:hypothetical protein